MHRDVFQPLRPRLLRDVQQHGQSARLSGQGQPDDLVVLVLHEEEAHDQEQQGPGELGQDGGRVVHRFVPVAGLQDHPHAPRWRLVLDQALL